MNNETGLMGIGGGPVGGLHATPRDHARAAFEAEHSRAASSSPAPLSTRDAVEKVRAEKRVGLDAVGRLCTLTGDTNLVDAELALRRADEATVEASRSVWMKDAPTLFFGAPPRGFSAGEFSPEQRREILIRSQQEEARRRGGR